MFIDENEWVVIELLIPPIYILAWWYVVFKRIGYRKNLIILDDEINVD
jgi:hypothetical protein